MPNRIPQSCDCELIAEQLHFGAQITQGQQDQQNRKPTCRMATPLRVAAVISHGSGPRE